MNQRGFVFTGRHMLFTMVAFFGVIIAVNVVMTVYASRTFSGLVAKNGYVASIDFARDEAARAHAAERGWQIDLSAPGGIVTLRARDRSGAPLAATPQVSVAEAGTAGEEQPLALTRVGEVLRAAAPLPPGHYVLHADVGPSEDRVVWRSTVVVDP